MGWSASIGANPDGDPTVAIHYGPVSSLRRKRLAGVVTAAVLAASAGADVSAARRCAPPVPGQPSLRADWLRGERATQPPSATSWIGRGIEKHLRFHLAGRPRLGLLARYQNPAVDRPPDWKSYYLGRYGAAQHPDGWRLKWYGQSGSSRPTETWASPELPWSLRLHPLPDAIDPAIGGAALPSWASAVEPVPEPEWAGLSRTQPCAAWQQPKPVTLRRHGREYARFQLLDCHGAVADGATDRLSVMARLPHTPRPSLPLPLVADPPDGEPGEWMAGVKMMHPRLVWVLQRFADAFPYRPIYIVSGYRRDRANTMHRRGRALDLSIAGVPNEQAFRLCRKLSDVGCGYYPRHRFIHVDVRPYGSGHPMWIDVSEPGMPSRYVDSWPGLVSGGALQWTGED